jgi:N6-adenosine-specific RNA methylase IME4
MKKYSVVYADPPWQQKAGQNISGGYKVVDGKQVFNPKSSKSENLPYPTMSLEQICDLKVKDIVEKDAHLYMWVTNKYLLQAKEVIEAWGFKYSTTLTWVKKPIGSGLGGSFRVNQEFLLFCTRGSLKAKRIYNRTSFEAKRPYVNGYPCHSKKPEFFRELIESVSPGPKIELFARAKSSENWDVWGNEVKSDIEL